MTTGLQAFDRYGRLIFDATKRCGRVLMSQRVSGGSGSFSDDRLTQGQPFVCFMADSLPFVNAVSKSLPPAISISGNTVTYSYTDGNPIAGTIIAGVY
ncbi:hypothetical protein [Burkholderia ubonensis]|uniref:hypothetical protein n=1 Tax=Burkholderia ubonensis TaxID=101571 RepID=UPI001114CCF4|nr:hypothetical protein [Burkholderia ubonensis]